MMFQWVEPPAKADALAPRALVALDGRANAARSTLTAAKAPAIVN
jgi:hypothetical protein